MASVIADIMTRDVFTLSTGGTLAEAVEMLRSRRIRHIPIVDGRHLVGIVTDRDVKRAMPSLQSGATQEEFNRVLHNTNVMKVMTRDPVSVHPQTPVREALLMLIDRKYGALPVVNDGELVGIVTDIDFLRLLEEKLR